MLAHYGPLSLVAGACERLAACLLRRTRPRYKAQREELAEVVVFVVAERGAPLETGHRAVATGQRLNVSCGPCRRISASMSSSVIGFRK